MTSPSSSPPPDWLKLPSDVTADILHRLGAMEILVNVQKVCMTWHIICKDPSLWKSIDVVIWNRYHHWEIWKLECMCRHAVDRSCGGLEHINIHYLASETMLHYIADRAPKLRSLQVAFGIDITENWPGEVAKKLPNLEELHIFFARIPVKAIESFGRSCPRLKSFTYSIEDSLLPYCNRNDESDRRALAIAQTMPGLRFLNLSGNQVTSKGLLAILDGCPLLEMLDRQSFYFRVRRNMARYCTSRIKNLKRPNDSTDGYKFEVALFGRCTYPSSE